MLDRAAMLGFVDDILRAALAPILRDLQDAGVAPARIEDDDWTGDADVSSAMVWSQDGSGTGIYVDRRDREVDRIVHLADTMQEWAIEERWGHASTGWPGCPRHPDGHPLQPTVRDGRAWWVCPTDHTAIVEIGSL